MDGAAEGSGESGFDGARFVAMFRAMAGAMTEARDRLCALDGAIGDADHGVAMALGFGAVREALDAAGAGASPAAVFAIAAKAFLNAVGASCGPLYATAFMRAGAALKGREAASAADVVALIPAMAEGIAHRGKAVPGDKTMLDAWRPAADAAAAAWADRPDLAAALRAAADAAGAGAAATRDMAARMGRSARLGERSVGHVDPGAASAAILIGVIADTLGRDP